MADPSVQSCLAKVVLPLPGRPQMTISRPCRGGSDDGWRLNSISPFCSMGGGLAQRVIKHLGLISVVARYSGFESMTSRSGIIIRDTI